MLAWEKPLAIKVPHFHCVVLFSLSYPQLFQNPSFIPSFISLLLYLLGFSLLFGLLILCQELPRTEIKWAAELLCNSLLSCIGSIPTGMPKGTWERYRSRWQTTVVLSAFRSKQDGRVSNLAFFNLVPSKWTVTSIPRIPTMANRLEKLSEYSILTDSESTRFVYSILFIYIVKELSIILKQGIITD